MPTYDKLALGRKARDLGFAENLAKDAAAAKRERISELMGRYATNEGYALKDKSKHTHALDSFVYSYTNAAGNPDNIKVEINYILRGHALPVVEASALTGGTFPDFPVRTLSPVEIFASKIVALTSRGAARDLYDLNNMVYFSLFDEPDLTILRKCAVFYLAVAGDMDTDGFSFEPIESITSYKIKTELLPMIRNKERFDLQAARDRVSAFLREHMTLTEKEAAFLKHFTAGQYEPQLLFEDEDIINRIENHPMALWRLQHIREDHGEK
ncbi:MAG: nucleotidyl transferase AbiEii/AbiGii toxin family protein [Clostridiales bacterium]|nr:nucleotidyl transferase AbiEii/AbiGii toxin family protein [Clostridiales bacterium]